MISYDHKEGWSEEDPSARQQESPEQATGKIGEPGDSTARPKVLARLPNLDVAEADRVAGVRPPRTSRRKLQRRISTLVLVGGTLALVAVAVYPHLRGPGKYEDGKWNPGTLAPDAAEAPAFGTQPSGPAPAVQTQSDAPAIAIEVPAVTASIPGSPAPDSTTVPAPQNSPITMPPMMPAGQPSQPAPIPGLPFGPNTPPAAPEVNIETPSAYSLPTRPSAPTLFTNSGRDLNGQAPAAAYGVNPSNTAIAYHPAANPVDRTAAYSSTYPNTGYEGPVMPLLPESVAPPATLSANGYGNSADTSTARQNYDSLRPGLR